MLRMAENCWYLLSLAGSNAQPERHHCQGPQASRALACWQLQRVSQVLQGRGFEVVNDRSGWEMAAWRLRRQLINRRAGNQVNCIFEEDQVWPWPGK
ncbi:MAG: hypothetical protein R3292_08610 [Alcanivorax sp.]|nr:hypothetical protein [Alcanivorax sp.]